MSRTVVPVSNPYAISVQAVHQLPADKCYRTTVVAAETDLSASQAADNLKTQLHDLEEERKAATVKAETMATKSQRLGEAIENLQAGAVRAMRQNDEAAARELLQVCFHQLTTSLPAQCNHCASSCC